MPGHFSKAIGAMISEKEINSLLIGQEDLHEQVDKISKIEDYPARRDSKVCKHPFGLNFPTEDMWNKVLNRFERNLSKWWL